MGTKYFLVYQIIIILSIVGLLLPSICFTQEAEAPKTLEEAKTIGERILIDLPGVLKSLWQEVLGWFKNLWDSYFFPWLENIWQSISSFLGKEVEKRKPEIEEEFEKEKKEMKEEVKMEVPRIGKSLWQRFKELIK